MNDNQKKDSFLSKLSDKLKKIKHLDIILTILFIAIILLIYFSSTGLFSSKKTNDKSSSLALTSNSSDTMDSYVLELSSNLESLISNMSGVSNAKVMLYYDEDISYDIAYTQETKTTSSGETVQTKSPVLVESDGSQKPIILSKNLPSPKSIIVVASGAQNTSVKLEILRLIQSMFEISSSRIEIFAGK